MLSSVSKVSTSPTSVPASASASASTGSLLVTRISNTKPNTTPSYSNQKKEWSDGNSNTNESVQYQVGKEGKKYITFTEAAKIIAWAEKKGFNTFDNKKYIVSFKKLSDRGEENISIPQLVEFTSSLYDSNSDTNENVKYQIGKEGKKYITFTEAAKIIAWAEKKGFKTFGNKEYIISFKKLSDRGEENISIPQLVEFTSSLHNNQLSSEPEASFKTSSHFKASNNFKSSNKLSWLELSPESKNTVQNLQCELVKKEVELVNRVPLKDLHITLAFLGKDVPEEVLRYMSMPDNSIYVELDQAKIFNNKLVICSSVGNEAIRYIHSDHIEYAEKNGVSIASRNKWINEHITLAHNVDEKIQEKACKQLNSLIDSLGGIKLEGTVHAGFTSGKRTGDYAFTPIKNNELSSKQ